jgi:hypothetical protein
VRYRVNFQFVPCRARLALNSSRPPR